LVYVGRRKILTIIFSFMSRTPGVFVAVCGGSGVVLGLHVVVFDVVDGMMNVDE
jgi:hypothetical protein